MNPTSYFHLPVMSQARCNIVTDYVRNAPLDLVRIFMRGVWGHALRVRYDYPKYMDEARICEAIWKTRNASN
jgi:hypothetical protein